MMSLLTIFGCLPDQVYLYRMNRYFIELSFKGTNYHGWQIQPNAISVQSVIEDALFRLTRERISTTGAGRTDTGVHARFFAVHFDCLSDLPKFSGDFVYKINAILPPDIVIHDVFPVKPEVHARFSALSRTYEYVIVQKKDPFDTEFSWFYPVPLDVEAMNQAAGLLTTCTDFTSFSKLHSDVKSNHCHVMQAGWTKNGHRLVFSIEADRFLRNMVRAIVGTLVDAGRNKTDPEALAMIIRGRHRSLAGASVPAKGLSLIAIKYPPDIRS
jgi:tRNA pseudouridine38-40 synthase